MWTGRATGGQFLATLALCAVAGWAGLASAADKPENPIAGGQVWNCSTRTTVRIGDFYGPNVKKPEPITIRAFRNSSFSGEVIVTHSNANLEGLKATATDLVGPDKAVIPAFAVMVRYALRSDRTRSNCPAFRFDALVTTAPADVAVVDPKAVGSPAGGKAGIGLGPVATVPVWVTANVPADAVPGEYTGTLKVDADNMIAVDVPVKLTVLHWVMPDPKDFYTAQLGMHDPETVARMYNVEPWSARHLELMARVFELMAQLNSRRVEVNLAAGTYAHGTGMPHVSYTRAKDGTFKADFTNFEKYMDMVSKAIGKPNPIRLNLWEVHREAKLGDPKAAGKPIPYLDEETGKRATTRPAFDTEFLVAFWKPVLAELRDRLEKRGWFDVTVVGDYQYTGPPNVHMVDVYARIWPDGRWFTTQHGTGRVFEGTQKSVRMPVLYSECVWVEGAVRPRGYAGLLHRTQQIHNDFARDRHNEASDLWIHRTLPEEMIYRGHRGVGPLGADVWPVPDGKGRSVRLAGGGALCLAASTHTMLAAAPDGPAPTERFEVFREGLQLCEAMIYIQGALGSKKLPADLAKRADALLQARGDNYTKAQTLKGSYGSITPAYTKAIAGEGSEQRDIDLMQMADEVSRALSAGGAASPATAPAKAP